MVARLCKGRNPRQKEKKQEHQCVVLSSKDQWYVWLLSSVTALSLHDWRWVGRCSGVASPSQPDDALLRPTAQPPLVVDPPSVDLVRSTARYTANRRRFAALGSSPVLPLLERAPSQTNDGSSSPKQRTSSGRFWLPVCSICKGQRAIASDSMSVCNGLVLGSKKVMEA